MAEDKRSGTLEIERRLKGLILLINKDIDDDTYNMANTGFMSVFKNIYAMGFLQGSTSYRTILEQTDDKDTQDALLLEMAEELGKKIFGKH